MTESTKTILGVAAVVAVAGVGFYLYKKGMLPGQARTGAPIPVPGSGAKGGGTGPNASTSPAFNGDFSQYASLGGKVIDWFRGAGASSGHLPNGNGGATAVPTSTYSAEDDSADYGEEA